MSTLAEITGIERDDLTKKFQLEPLFCSDPNRIKNVAFMSPLVLLKDSELKPGGYQDRGPKTTLGRIAKDILLEPNGHNYAFSSARSDLSTLGVRENIRE